MTKRWLDTFVVSSLRCVKGVLALALCLGTFGVALTVVAVSPAGAANTAPPAILSVSPTSGLPAGGAKVTILGTNLLAATAVNFGTATGTITSNTAGKIVVTSPVSALAAPGFGTVDITVTTALGTSPIVSADQFTYEGAPTVTALYGGNAPVNGGTTIIVQGTNFTGATAVDFSVTAATSFTVQSSTQIQVLVPAIGNEAVGAVFNVTVTTGAGTSAKATANQWYWFGSGSCAFSGTGVQNSGAPPGASAYIQDAVAGTSTTNPSGGTTIPTACTGLSGLGTTSPMIESLSEATAAIVTGTGPGGNGGNESWLGWSGANGYSDTTTSTYNAPAPGYQLPKTGPSTSGGCPVSGSLCVVASQGGTPVYYGSDPTATCPPSQAQTDAGLVDCSVAALTASQGTPPSTYIAATLQISYANDPTPDPATATFTSGTVAPGNTVTLNPCGSCNWWGAGSEGAPSFVPPIGPTGTAVAVPAPAVWVGTTRAAAVQASAATDTLNITPATYDCGSSGGASTTSPGPVANCTLAQGTMSGSFVMPTVTCSPCHVYIDEPNLSLTQSTYTADGGTGTYNNGLTYQLVNSVESTTTISCPTCTGGGGSTPTVTGVSPTNGPAAGGTSVTLTGTNLTGATAVDFGATAGTGITSVTANSLTVTAPAGTGTVDVTVTTPSGTSAVNSPSDHYTYNAPALPTVTGVSPTSGTTAGGTSVTLTGTNLTGATAVHFGANAGTGITSVTATGLTVTAPAGTGTVDVTVTTPNGTSAVNSPADQYTYNAPALPTVTGVSPTSGPTAGGTSVTVSGTGFTGATAVDFGASHPGAAVNVINSTTLTVTSPAGTGTVDVTVTTPNGTSAINSPADQYTYNAPALPTVSGVSPNNGPQGGGNSVTVNGANFGGATAVHFGANAGTGITSVTATSLTVTVPAGTSTVDVTVTTPNGTSAVNSPADQYTYNAAPTVTGVTPNNGSQAGGNSVTVNGTGFSGTPTVDFGSTPGTGVGSVTATSLTVTVPAGTGTVSVTVTTTAGGASTPLTNAYTYNAPPTVTAVSPTSGPAGGGTSVTLTGTGLTGATAVHFGANAGTGITSVTATGLTVTAPAGTGTVDVTVTTPNGTSAINSPADHYTYNLGPTVTGVSPNNGAPAGGNSVTVSGTNLTGATVVDFGSTPGTGISAVTATSLIVTVPAGAGTVDVTVTTPSGTSAINAPSDQYTYNGPPTVSGVSPNNGPQGGGNSVTVNGSNFSGATAVHFGANAGSGITSVTETSLTVTVPAGTGTVDVTVTTANGTSAINSPADNYTYNAAPTVTGVTPNNGPQAGGNSVTVNGTNFTGTPTVDFGSTPGTGVTSVTATSLTVTVPSGTGTVSVTVTTTAGGASTPLANAYTYNAPPTVTGVTPDNGPQAGGNSVTVNGTGFSGTPTVDFGSTAGTGVTSVTATSLTVTVPAGTGTVSVKVITTGGGASNALASAYTYNGPPTVTGVSPNNGPAAGGTSVTVSGTGFTGATAVDFGASNPGASVNVTNSTTLTVNSPAGTGTVDLTVTTPNGTSEVNSPSDQFTYNGPPTVSGVSPNSGPQNGTNSVTVNGSNFSGATAVHFGGTAGSGITSVTETSLTVNVPSGTGTVDVTVTTPNGTSAINSPADNYTYIAPPTVSGVTPNNGPAAGGNIVTVNGTGFSGTPTVDFGSTPGTGVGSVTATSLSVTVPSGTGSVSVTVTTTAGGASTPLANAYTYNAPPTVTGVTPNNGPQAGGNSVTVNGTGFSGTPTVDFGSTPGTGVGSVTGTSLTVTVPAGTGSVSVKVITTSGGASNALAGAYTYNGPPTVTGVSPNNGPQSGGTSVTLTGTGLTGATAVHFGSTAGTGIASVTATGLTVTAPAGSGAVDVTVTTPNGTSAVNSPSDQYTYNAPPNVTGVSPAGGPTGGGTSVTVTGTGFTGATEVDFGDDNPGTGIDVASGGTSLTVTSPSGTGTVDVSVTTPNGIGTDESAFTYVLAPTITSVNPSQGSTAGGTVVTIAGANLASPSAVTFGGNHGTVTASSASSITVTTPAGAAGPAVNVAVTTLGGSVTDNGAFTYVAPVVTNPSTTQGYWEVASDGGVFSFGGAGFYGSAGGLSLNAPIVGMASTADGGGYWLVGKDGGVFAYGDAKSHGSRGGQFLNAPIVGMASTPDGGGYWLVANDGGVFAYGDAHFYGSRGGQFLNAPIVGMASTPDGGGYWLVANDGGVFAYGDAHFYGSRGGKPLNAPIVGMASTPGGGYWLVGKDGGVFAYGDAHFYGSGGGTGTAVSGIGSSPDGGGYWLAASNGGSAHYGDATSFGSGSSKPLNNPVVGIAVTG